MRHIHALQASEHLLVDQISQGGCKDCEVVAAQPLTLQALLKEALDEGWRAVLHDAGGGRCLVRAVHRPQSVEVPTMLLHEISVQSVTNWHWLQPAVAVLRQRR